MSTEWAVIAAGDRFTLDAHNSGELTFTVSNPGTVADTVVFDVVPGDGSDRSWFTVSEPRRMVKPKEAATFQVKIEVPAGTPARQYELTGMAYSADTAPEESSRTSGRVAYEVGPSRAPKKMPWPIIIAAIALVLVVAGVATFLLWPSGGSGSRSLQGTYRGQGFNDATKETSQIVLTLTQKGSQLTATIKDLAFPNDTFLGSGTATEDGDFTLHFDIEGAVTFAGKEISPGRLQGKFTYDNGSASGTFDVCTCTS